MGVVMLSVRRSKYTQHSNIASVAILAQGFSLPLGRSRGHSPRPFLRLDSSAALPVSPASMATGGHAGGYLAPPLPLSLVAPATQFWLRLSPVTQEALKRAGLDSSSGLCYAFDGSVEDAHEFVVGAGGVSGDVQLLPPYPGGLLAHCLV